MPALFNRLPIETVISEFVDPAIRATGATNDLNPITMTAINLAGVCYTGNLDPFDPSFTTNALAYLRDQADGPSLDFARNVYGLRLDEEDVILHACRMAHEAALGVSISG